MHKQIIIKLGVHAYTSTWQFCCCYLLIFYIGTYAMHYSSFTYHVCKEPSSVLTFPQVSHECEELSDKCCYLAANNASFASVGTAFKLTAFDFKCQAIRSLKARQICCLISTYFSLFPSCFGGRIYLFNIYVNTVQKCVAKCS